MGGRGGGGNAAVSIPFQGSSTTAVTRPSEPAPAGMQTPGGSSSCLRHTARSPKAKTPWLHAAFPKKQPKKVCGGRHSQRVSKAKRLVVSFWSQTSALHSST
ncbi:hypothetical protein MN608_05936 [Microdochium nivale]|nr:hypothetical protein MN608_05936 [Microdochium nivale]